MDWKRVEMRLSRFSNEGAESFGTLEADRIVDLPLLAKRNGQPLASTLDALIQSEASEEPQLNCLVQESSPREIRKASLPIDRLRLLAPIKTPPKIICLGLNYKDHAAEQGAASPDEPVIFMKPRTAVVGPDESIVKPPFVKQLDYEAELAIVVGRRGRNISIDDAETHIFGYTILNDVSARDIQFKDKQWTRGKSFDTFAPTGPCIALTDQIGDPTNLRVRTWVNEEIRQDSTTRNMVFNVFQIVHSLSRIMTLEPCDLIATGTPSGVGFAMKPQPQFLQHGDCVKIEVENVGVLRNNVVDEEPAIYG
jgi:2-keto-4-pentenoate hydratase/2-oxohepta-3-ene-1,7-dioic acid hydratase in catechol pathway